MNNQVALVDFGEIHAVSELKAGNLAGMKLHFQVCLQDGNVNGLTLCRVRALGTDLVQFHVAVMRLYEFVYDGVHTDHCSSSQHFHKSPKDLRRVLGKL
jgi:hypothetical protein